MFAKQWGFLKRILLVLFFFFSGVVLWAGEATLREKPTASCILPARFTLLMFIHAAHKQSKPKHSTGSPIYQRLRHIRHNSSYNARSSMTKSDTYRSKKGHLKPIFSSSKVKAMGSVNSSWYWLPVRRKFYMTEKFWFPCFEPSLVEIYAAVVQL